jgi:hypothetical protein
MDEESQGGGDTKFCASMAVWVSMPLQISRDAALQQFFRAYDLCRGNGR